MNKEKTELGYNGWANRETWLVNVWDYLEYFVDSAFDSEQKPDDIDASDLEDQFRDLIDSDIPSNGIVSDMVSGALALIDWRTIAEHVREQLEQRILDDF
tara:strand:- start:63 stop:362 length:300 start_codon:yes stop_codon:yes gene_type:complete